jgi:cytochrome c oxidase subunit 1
LGSTISIVGVVWFIYIVYDAYSHKIKFVGWVDNDYSPSLEWVNTSPPAWHGYETLPLVINKGEVRRGKRGIDSGS